MITSPGLQIYIRSRITLTLNLLTSKGFCFMPHGLRRHQNRFIRFQNIMFTSLVTDERTNKQTG